MNQKKYNVPAVEKTLDILEYLMKNSKASLTQIHQDLGYPKSTTYGILYTLQQRGYIRKSANEGFQLGFKLYELGNFTIENIDFVNEAIPIMKELAHRIGFTCHLGIVEGDGGIYLEKVQPPSPIKLNSWRGRAIQFHCTSLGKVLLAYQSLEEIVQILNRIPLTKKTEKTITNKEILLSELLKIKQQGYAVDEEEHEPDITCLAAPIFDYSGRVIAAISLSGLSTWLTPEKKEEIIKDLIQSTHIISKRIGAKFETEE